MPGPSTAHGLTTVCLIIVAGCSGGIGSDDPSASSAGGAEGGTGSGASGAGASGAGGPGSGGDASGSGGAGAGPGSGGDGGADQQVCARWQADRADISEGSWSGSVAGCNAGDVSAEGRANALKLVNLYRWLAALPAVATDGSRDQMTQACALMMQANGALSHSPPPSWQCYSQAGADAAGSSNISPTPTVAAIDLYMADPGNETTLGHRRWILSGSLGPIGIGSTDGYSCLWVTGGAGNTALPFVAWPPPGQFPSGAFTASWAPLQETGWSIQSSTIDLSGASVAIQDAGESLAVSVTELIAGYGDTWALRIVPQGWNVQPGHTYSVTVTGASQPIGYDVVVVDCP